MDVDTNIARSFKSSQMVSSILSMSNWRYSDKGKVSFVVAKNLDQAWEWKESRTTQEGRENA